MKATIIESHGSKEVLKYVEDFSKPVPKQGEVLVKVHYTSVNRVDLVVRKGYPGLTLPLPHILGGDIAGVVEAIGEDVFDIEIGKKVVVYPVRLPQNHNPRFGKNKQLNDGWQFFGMQTNGAYAEYICVPAENICPLSEKTNLAEAAALPIAGVTAYHALFSVAKLSTEDVFFIWGGSGGMGTLCVQMAKLAGATVIATVGKDEKKEALIALGADYVFNHHTDDVVSEVRKLYPSGVDLVLDYVGPATFDKSISMLIKNGKMLFCGMLTGMKVEFNIQQFYTKHLNFHGLYLGNIHDFRNLIQLLEGGAIKPHIHQILHISEASKAHEIIESGDYIGKVVLEIK